MGAHPLIITLRCQYFRSRLAPEQMHTHRRYPHPLSRLPTLLYPCDYSYHTHTCLCLRPNFYTYEQKLLGSDTDGQDAFGYSVSIDEDHELLVVGAPYAEDNGVTEVRDVVFVLRCSQESGRLTAGSLRRLRHKPSMRGYR